MNRKRLLKNEKGQGLVEFALVLPILAILILGMLEFGWILYNRISVVSAAREGVRVAAVVPSGQQTKAEIEVVKYIGNTNVTVTYSKYPKAGDPDYLDGIPTAVVLVEKEISPLVGLFYDKNSLIKISSTARMRIE